MPAMGREPTFGWTSLTGLKWSFAQLMIHIAVPVCRGKKVTSTEAAVIESNCRIKLLLLMFLAVLVTMPLVAILRLAANSFNGVCSGDTLTIKRFAG